MLLSDKDPFGRGKWQDFLNQLAFLNEHKLSAGDVEVALNSLTQNNPVTYLKCPECGSLRQLLPINDSPSTQTGDDSKSMWLCRNCHYEQFSDKTVNEELELLKES